MLRLTVKTKKKPAEVVKEAIKFFGPDGYGMKITEQSDTCAYFEGSGGGIAVTTCAETKGSSVDLESREWDIQLREFARKIS